MTRATNRSRSSAVYALVVKLYPPEFLHRRRAELRQNFEDLEEASASQAALWLLIGKDLMISFVARSFPRSLWGRTALMVIILAIVLAALRVLTSRPYFMGASPSATAS